MNNTLYRCTFKFSSVRFDCKRDGNKSRVARAARHKTAKTSKFNKNRNGQKECERSSCDPPEVKIRIDDEGEREIESEQKKDTVHTVIISTTQITNHVCISQW